MTDSRAPSFASTLRRPEPPAGGLSRMHLTAISELTNDDLQFLLSLSQYYARLIASDAAIPPRLAGRTQINLFFENSTRTNCSFELAAKKLGANVIMVPVAASSVHKGEELKDTVQTLAAMGADAMIVRHTQAGSAQLVADVLGNARIPTAVINAGEGMRAHPTQALLDALTMLNALDRSAPQGLNDVTIAICGDVRHSRVARSNTELLPRLGATVRFVGPTALHPDANTYPKIDRFENLEAGLRNCDFVMTLRMQFERMEGALDLSPDDYYQHYGLTHTSLRFANPGAKILHPGPMNRGIEIAGALADDREVSLVLDQVANGVSTRMAVLDALLTEQE